MSIPNLVPLAPQPQTLQITLAGVAYTLRVVWNVPNDSWVLDVLDAGGDPVLCGVPLVTGADLLEQFNYLGIGGGLVVQTASNTDAVPTFANLGTDGNLYFVTP